MGMFETWSNTYFRELYKYIYEIEQAYNLKTYMNKAYTIFQHTNQNIIEISQILKGLEIYIVKIWILFNKENYKLIKDLLEILKKYSIFFHQYFRSKKYYVALNEPLVINKIINEKKFKCF